MRIELLHPMIVHFPIVFTLSLFLFDLLAVSRGWSMGRHSPAGVASLSLAIAGGATAALAYFLGDIAYEIAQTEQGVGESLLERHEEFGSITALLLVIWAVLRLALWWRDHGDGRAARLGGLAVEAVLAGLVMATAFYGGSLVFEHGIAVSQLAGS